MAAIGDNYIFIFNGFNLIMENKNIKVSKPEYMLILLGFFCFYQAYVAIRFQIIFCGKYVKDIFAKDNAAILFGYIFFIVSMICYYVFFSNFIKYIKSRIINTYLLNTFYFLSFLILIFVPIYYEIRVYFDGTIIHSTLPILVFIYCLIIYKINKMIYW
ncbi:MAG TPA: hypothetical protein P5295_17035 [Spirochaetota bacterium]|nr:hypothetical protein [Spirochaetota bacterium]